MEIIVDVINEILSWIFYIYLFIVFLLSVKKCFWKEGRSKVGVFFLTLIAFPLQWYFLSVVLSYTLFELPLYLITGDLLITLKTDIYSFSASLINSIIFPFIVLFLSFIGTKWLKIKNGAQYLFLYLMIIVLFFSSVRADSKGNIFGIPLLGNILSIISIIVSSFAVWLFYRLIVSRFSELIKENIRINWKLFIIPPLAFSMLYSAIAFPMIIMSGKNEEIAFVSFAFANIIVYLFIWAFYVIIKNMMATNEAIKAKEEIKTLSVEVMEALAHTIDAKDEYTKGHSVRVAKYSRMLAEKLGLNEGDCESVYYMALLHDIGKIGVPNEIINSKSKMTDEEYAIMKTHPAIGSDILEEIKSRPDLMIGARWHHERYDGKGYPDQKAGEDIPYFARIISVADSYDAMTSNRSYRNYLPQDVVRGEIEKNCGTQFDPNVAKCMLSIIDEDVNYEYHE